MSVATHTSPVKVSLAALQNQHKEPIPTPTLLEAFGPSSLGILLVSDLPSHFSALRSRVLAKISHLAHLPQSQLDVLVNERAKYLVGWSHGKESLREGVVDWLKGSYYVNTAFDEKDAVLEKMRQDWRGFDEYTAANVWPDENYTNERGEQGLHAFRKDVEELVSLIVNVAGFVARAVDEFGEHNVENWPARKQVTNDNAASGLSMGYLESIVRGSRTSKARLLHYFPSTLATSSNSTESTTPGDIASDNMNDSWCTTHKDHSCLTGLTSAAFFDETSPSVAGTYTELPTSPSPAAGLYILDRTSQVHKVAIPKDCLAFQTGEALELITKGKLKAVPHFVRGVDGKDEGVQGKLIARNTLAVFTQPNLDDVVDLERKTNFGDWARGIVNKNTAG